MFEKNIMYNSLTLFPSNTFYIFNNIKIIKKLCSLKEEVVQYIFCYQGK